MFIKPFTAKMTIDLCQELTQLRINFMGELSTADCIKRYSGHKSLKAIVTLVLTSLN